MRIQENAQLKKLCTFQIGGTAKYLINWANRDEISEIVAFALEQKLPLFFFGGGSNLLFPDADLSAILVRCMTSEINYDQGLVVVDAGVRWTALQHFCRDHELYGLEPLFSVPGTIGGAIVGNAGCHGQEAVDVLEKVEYYCLKTRKIENYQPTEADFAYRWSIFKDNPHWVVLRAWFRVSKSADDAIGDPASYAEFRQEKQPQGLTTGSFFKNPYPDHAGALLEQVGLKGYRLGNVGFSEKHANFVLNYGDGTAADVKALTEMAQERVKATTGITLEPEVRIVDEKDFIRLA